MGEEVKGDAAGGTGGRGDTGRVCVVYDGAGRRVTTPARCGGEPVPAGPPLSAGAAGAPLWIFYGAAGNATWGLRGDGEWDEPAPG